MFTEFQKGVQDCIENIVAYELLGEFFNTTDGPNILMGRSSSEINNKNSTQSCL